MSIVTNALLLELAGLLSLALSIGTSVRVILRKRDARAAIGWIGLIWLAPVVGSWTYLVLGVNRIGRIESDPARPPRLYARMPSEAPVVVILTNPPTYLNRFLAPGAAMRPQPSDCGPSGVALVVRFGSGRS